MSALINDAEADARRKLLATTRAELALAGGFELHEMDDGAFAVSRWNLFRVLPDLAAVREFVERVSDQA